MPLWEYAILTRLSAGLDTKWYVNRTYQHTETDLPTEVTDPVFRSYNQRFDDLHATKVYPVLPAILNLMGADGWELIDDMQMGITGGEGLVFKRTYQAGHRGTAQPARKAGKSGGRKATTKRRS